MLYLKCNIAFRGGEGGGVTYMYKRGRDDDAGAKVFGDEEGQRWNAHTSRTGGSNWQ